jgi:hypothetical protein
VMKEDRRVVSIVDVRWVKGGTRGASLGNRCVMDETMVRRGGEEWHAR